MFTLSALMILLSGFPAASGAPETRASAPSVITVAAADASPGSSRSNETSKLEHAPTFHISNRTDDPVLRAEKPWESYCVNGVTVIRESELWRMWYGAYDRNYKRDDDASLCYAESPDGLHWTKPELGIVDYQGSKANNILIYGPQVGGFAFSYVFLDSDRNASEKYKMIWQKFNQEHSAWWVYGATSSDGIHWNLLPSPLSPHNSDTTTTCISDQGKYRLYTRLWSDGDFRGSRIVGYTESDHFGDFPEPVEVFRHDKDDPDGMQFYSNAATKLSDQLYVMLPAAFYTKNQTVRSHLAWSRDGVHFIRYGREPVVDVGGKFDKMSVYVMPGATPGDTPNTWWFYYGGTNIEHDANPADVKYEGGIGRFLLTLK